MAACERILTMMVMTGVVLLGSVSSGEPWSLAARLLDLKSGAPPASPLAGRVAVDSGEDVKDLAHGGDGRYSVALPAQVTRVTVLVDVRDRLVPRKVPLLLRAGTSKALSLTLYVVEREPITYDYANAPRAWYGRKEYDRALAAFEFAYDDLTTRGVSISELRVTVEYYYGLALRSTCEFLRYDTCMAAAERFGNLIQNYRGNEKYYRVPLAELEAAKKAAEKIRVAVRYDAIRMAYAAQNFAAAAEAAEALIADAEATEVRLDGTSISLDRLRLDAASSRAQLGDRFMKQAATAEAMENYKTAIDHARAVTTLEKARAIKDADILSEKLAVLESKPNS